MLTADRIRELFEALNRELMKRELIGEVGICGGAVMCLVFQTRRATKDVDGIFVPAAEMREAIAAAGRSVGAPEDWLNDAAKGFFACNPPRQEVASYSNLRIWAPTAEYMLAMKCVSARYDSADRDDVIFLVKHLGLKSPDEAFAIISKYYPHNSVPAKTAFFVEELFEKRPS